MCLNTCIQLLDGLSNGMMDGDDRVTLG